MNSPRIECMLGMGIKGDMSMKVLLGIIMVIALSILVIFIIHKQIGTLLR